MIAVDTSTIIAYFTGEMTPDTHRFHGAIISDEAALCPIVITEVLSGTEDIRIHTQLKELNALPFLPGFWERAATARRILIKKSYKAKLADAIIAQSAIDYGVPLLTRDRDFRHYATYCGLELLS